MAANQRCAGLLSGLAGAVSSVCANSGRSGMGVMTSGFAFLRIDAYYQEIVKGMIIAAAVVDQYRQRCGNKA